MSWSNRDWDRKNANSLFKRRFHGRRRSAITSLIAVVRRLVRVMCFKTGGVDLRGGAVGQFARILHWSVRIIYWYMYPIAAFKKSILFLLICTSGAVPLWFTLILFFFNFWICLKYRKISKISLRAYIFQRPFFEGLIFFFLGGGGLNSERLTYGGKFAFQNRLG